MRGGLWSPISNTDIHAALLVLTGAKLTEAISPLLEMPPLADRATYWA